MADQQALIRVFADYARTLTQPYEVGDVLYRLTDQVVQVLGVDGAGVSIADRDRLSFVSATDEDIAIIEERQASVGQGPCHDAFTSDDRVTSADLTVEERWPAYTPVAVEQGCRAVAGIPMRVDAQRIGALNVYVKSQREWPADELDIAQVLADMATSYIINARSVTEPDRTTAQLHRALDTRVVVEQAKGILAERHRINPAAAFELLRRYARNQNAKAHDIAGRIVDGTLDL